MLATILLLAQIVQSWPWLDSPLVQPGPTICVGECVGPVVWGPAERGRLVVACDMRSDTCSDGRKISTQRATPVPCETSPGVWEMVGVDEGCYSVRGLESWAQNTSYLSWGAELDRSPWGGLATATKVGSTYRVCAETSSAFRQQLRAEDGGVVRTAACLVRAGTSRHIRLLAADVSSGGVSFDYALTDEWQTVTATATVVEGGGVAGVRLHPARSGAGCVEVAGCWSVIGDTPGRACWGGEAPVTCAADRHTISTDGWPTESGEISLVYTPQDVGIGAAMYLVATTTASGDGRPSGFYLYRISASGALVFGLRRGDTTSGQNTQGLVWENGRSYHVRVRWLPERAEIWRDGVLLRSWAPTVVPDSHPDVVHIGTNMFGGEPAQGSIRALTVRSYEEVSP